MICSFCGTEYRGAYCPRCGHKEKNASDPNKDKSLFDLLFGIPDYPPEYVEKKPTSEEHKRENSDFYSDREYDDDDDYE